MRIIGVVVHGKIINCPDLNCCYDRSSYRSSFRWRKRDRKILKNQTLEMKKAFTIQNAKGKITFRKVGGSDRLSITSSGKITVKKGTKKGTKKMDVLITAAGNNEYLKWQKTVTVKVKIVN